MDNAPNGKLPEGATHVNYLDEALRSIIDAAKLETTRTEVGGCEFRPAKPKAN